MTSTRGCERPLLTLAVKLPDPTHTHYTWIPFRLDLRFEPTWWNEPRYLDDTYRYIEVLMNDTEVARIALSEDIGIENYPTAPQLGDEALEIQLIEVSSDYHRQGVGTEVIRLLTEAHPHRRLIAFSEQADDFWTSLGWHRHDHPLGPAFYRPLFIQPSPFAE